MNNRITIGIDLGNTNCSLAYSQADGKPGKLIQLVDERDRVSLLKTVLRTVVFYPYDGSGPIVGPRAMEVQAELGIRFANFKVELLTHSGKELPVRAERNLKMTALDAVTDILRNLRRQASSSTETRQYFTSGAPLDVTLCVPTQSSEAYKQHILNALVHSEWFASEHDANDHCTFISEPVAAALCYRNPGERFLVFDFGGLTLDLALMEPDADELGGYRVLTAQRVQAEVDGRTQDLGGSLLDRRLLRVAVEKLGGIGKLRRYTRQAYGYTCDDDLLGDLISGKLFKDDPIVIEAERVIDTYEQLLFDIEKARVRFSPPTQPQPRIASVPFLLNAASQIDPDADTGLAIEDGDFEPILEPVIDAIRRAVNHMMKDTGKEPASIMLVGGASWTPSISRALKLDHGSDRVWIPNDYDPMVIIAAGAAARSLGTPERRTAIVDQIVETDYGVWVRSRSAFDPIIKQGTRISDTALPESGKRNSDHGVYQVYYSIGRKRSIEIRVGQRDANSGNASGWRELAMFVVNIPDPQKDFRIYFSIDARTSMLTVHLRDDVTGEFLGVERSISMR